MKVSIVGTGYVGLSLAVLLANAGHDVVALDILKDRVEQINKGDSPINDKELKEFLPKVVKSGKLIATTDKNKAYVENNPEFVVVATPTDYNPVTDYFDTSIVEAVIKDALKMTPEKTVIVVKSTIPIGFVKSMRQKFSTSRIMFSPEFLREGRSLYDSFYPSRVIVGDTNEKAQEFANLLAKSALKKDVPIKLMNPTEAESVKLFANAYLANRVAFFNELDSFAMQLDLNAKDIIEGVCLDPRIGMHYNNPSFGYGGYCFPKDTKQLLANFKKAGVYHTIVEAIVVSNSERKKYIVDFVLKKGAKKVGIYKLIIKVGSDNYRSSALFAIIDMLRSKGVKVYVYEPILKGADKEKLQKTDGIFVVNKLKDLNKCDIVLANRYDDKLDTLKVEILSRDAFHIN